eukprot:scaffold27067_cov17-Tisochrysis_lutea.AAC.1
MGLASLVSWSIFGVKMCNACSPPDPHQLCFWLSPPRLAVSILDFPLIFSVCTPCVHFQCMLGPFVLNAEWHADVPICCAHMLELLPHHPHDQGRLQRM